MEADESIPVGWTQIPYYIIFDVKSNFTTKARLVAGAISMFKYWFLGMFHSSVLYAVIDSFAAVAISKPRCVYPTWSESYIWSILFALLLISIGTYICMLESTFVEIIVVIGLVCCFFFTHENKTASCIFIICFKLRKYSILLRRIP